METLMRNVGSWALGLFLMSIVSTALGETQPVKPKDHEAGTPETTTSTATTPTTGVIPAAEKPDPAAQAKVRLFQVKGILGEAIRTKPKEQQAQLLTTLSTPPKTEAQAEEQKKLAKDLIKDVSKDLLNEEEKKKIEKSAESLVGNAPATAEELRLAAKELVEGNKEQGKADAALAAAAAVPKGQGATSDPSKVAKSEKADDGKAVDPAKAATADLEKQLADAKKVAEDLKGQLAKAEQGLGQGNQANNADLAKALGDQNKGEEQGQGQPPGGGEKGGGTPPETASNKSKNDDHKEPPTPKNDKKDLPPLFADSKGSDKDKDKSSDKDSSKENKTSEPLFDMAKLKETPKEEKKVAKEETPKNEDAGGLGDAPQVAGVGGAKSEFPPGNSQIGQVMAQNSGGGAFDPGLQGDTPVSDAGGLGNISGNGNSGSQSAIGEFPQGVNGYEGGGGGPSPKYTYTKGLEMYAGGGGGGGGGGAGGIPDGDGDSDGDGTPDKVASPAEIAVNYAKRLAMVASQVLYSPAKAGFDTGTRPGPFGFTKVAKSYLKSRAKGNLDNSVAAVGGPKGLIKEGAILQ